MNSLDVIRKLIRELQVSIDEAEDFPDDHTCQCSACDAIKEAEAYLKTGGWHKWPEEKPEKHDRYLVVDKTVGEFYISIDYCGG